MPLVASKRSPREVEVGDSDDSLDCLEGDSPGRESFLVNLDLDLFFKTAGHLGGGDALDGLEILLDPALCEVAQGAEVTRSRERQAQDRVEARIEPQDDRALGLSRQVQAIYFFPDLHRHEVHIRTPLELEQDLGGACPRDRVNTLQAAENAYGFLDPAGYEVLDLLGGAVGEICLDRDGGIGNVGEELDGKPRVTHETEGDDSEYRHDHGHPSPDGSGDYSPHFFLNPFGPGFFF